MINAVIFCMLQLLTLTASREVTVDEYFGEINLRCDGDYQIKSKNGMKSENLMLKYEDKNSGEYQCVKDANEGQKIFVKFRTCENCIELDILSIVGMMIGDLVSTVIIGVGVYIVASTTRRAPVSSNRKESDGYWPPPHNPRVDPNDPYQRLRPKGQKDIYDDLKAGR